jgi:hypothetical protein
MTSVTFTVGGGVGVTDVDVADVDVADAVVGTPASGDVAVGFFSPRIPPTTRMNSTAPTTIAVIRLPRDKERHRSRTLGFGTDIGTDMSLLHRGYLELSGTRTRSVT